MLKYISAYDELLYPDKKTEIPNMLYESIQYYYYKKFCDKFLKLCDKYELLLPSTFGDKYCDLTEIEKIK